MDNTFEFYSWEDYYLLDTLIILRESLPLSSDQIRTCVCKFFHQTKGDIVKKITSHVLK